MFKRKLLHRTDSRAELQEFADLSAMASHGIGDLVRTQDGVLFVAGANFEFGRVDLVTAPDSPLIRVDGNGHSTIASDLTAFPNGMVITPDARRLIVADSLQFRLHQWDLAQDGHLSNHEIFARTPGSMPDGISLDQRGGVWVAAGHGGVFRVLRGGKVTDKVYMNNTGATACMLGGEDGRTLLITASDSTDREVISGNPSGRLFAVRVEVPGAGMPSWY